MFFLLLEGVKWGPGKDGQLPRSNPPSRLPEGAVFSGGRGWAKASLRTRIFSPQRAEVYHTWEKNHTLTNADMRSPGHRAGLRLRALPIFPTRRGPGHRAPAPGSGQAAATPALQLHFPLFSSYLSGLFFFFAFFWSFKKT